MTLTRLRPTETFRCGACALLLFGLALACACPAAAQKDAAPAPPVSSRDHAPADTAAPGMRVASASGAPARRPGAARATTAAAFAATTPVIDGRDDDAVWRSAPAVTAFREYDPIEDAAPRFRTSVRIAYDPGNLYVFLRAYDPHPDSIVTMLARRDAWTAADMMGVLVDSYHDRRTGYELDVNPSGVKTDWSIRNDGEEDGAWDGIWDVATRVDSLGWTAEFRIPLSQLGYRKGGHTFGIAVWRQVEREGERMSWPVRHTSRPGLSSQFADLTGLDGLAAPRRTQLLPYVLMKNVPQGAGAGRGQRATAGGDLTYALAPGFDLQATVNPDFGQVEADPAELNLTAFETFFPERRPFFVQDGALFATQLDCGLYLCYRESLFYSRRIGRAPELRTGSGDAASPGATPILGAAKLTGHLGGLTLGTLGAATQRLTGPGGATVEPAARYAVFRAAQSLRGGESGIGVTATATERSLDAASAPFLHRSAAAAALDFRHRFRKEYVLRGSVDWSRVAGTAAAIAATQRDPIHEYQRPDGALTLDTTRTALTGDDEELAFDKLGGTLRFEATYTRRSPGFEVNDLGYLRLADQQTGAGWLGLVFNRPTRFYRSLVANANAWIQASTAGLVTDRALNTNVHLTLPDRWTLGAWATLNGLGSTFCDRCARGGPALRQDRVTSTWFDVTGDDRHRILPEITLTTSSGDGGRSGAFTVRASAAVQATSRFQASLGASVARARSDAQWLENVTDARGRTHYAFARLDQRTLSLTARASYTLSTTLSLQAYAAPFISRGAYGDVRELADPRAATYADRFIPYAPPGGAPAGVDARQLDADVVLRWQYHRGSTLFLVWTQHRQASIDEPGPGGLLAGARGIVALPPDNTLLLKLSYWLDW